MKICAKDDFDVQKKYDDKKRERSWKFSREFLWWSWKQENVCRLVMRKILCTLSRWKERKKEICPGLAVGRKRIFLWMFLKRRSSSKTLFTRAQTFEEDSESVSFENFCGVKTKDEIPSQQLPSFMFLSWSWVLWKIFYHINVIWCNL